MKIAVEEAKALVDSWKALRAELPSEVDLAGYPGVRADHFDDLFGKWASALSTAYVKSKPASEVEDAISDAVLSKALREIRGVVQSARGNSLKWLLDATPFLQMVLQTSSYISLAVERRLGLRKDLLKAAESDLNNSLRAIESAAPQAAQLVDLLSKANEHTQRLTDANTTAAEATRQIGEIVQSITLKKAEAEKAAQESSALRDSLKETEEALKAALDQAEEELDEVGKQKKLSADSIQVSTKLISQTNEQLTKALQDINRQGLAGAFAAQSKAILFERIAWMAALAGSLGWLIYVAFGSTAFAIKSIEDFLGLLRLLPLAAPAIWLGWLAARNSGALSRIQHDYSYKAATAVAFEAYKKEVQAANDEALSKQLLETAVRNFGENPIRLLDGRGDKGHPIEDLAEMIKDENHFKKVVELIKAMKPEPK